MGREAEVWEMIDGLILMWRTRHHPCLLVLPDKRTRLRWR